MENEFIMASKELGARFKFHAATQEAADLTAKKYCLYHSMPGKFYAEPVDPGAGYNTYLISFNDEYVEDL